MRVTSKMPVKIAVAVAAAALVAGGIVTATGAYADETGCERRWAVSEQVAVNKDISLDVIVTTYCDDDGVEIAEAKGVPTYQHDIGDEGRNTVKNALAFLEETSIQRAPVDIQRTRVTSNVGVPVEDRLMSATQSAFRLAYGTTLTEKLGIPVQ